MGRYTKKTIHLPRMWKNTFHKFGKFHQKMLQLYTCNLRKITRIRIHYSYVVSKKAEIIKLENGIKLNRQTAYYHESTYDKSFITQKEENLQKLLKETKIEPSGIYHYDEEFLYENGVATVRLAIIDAVTNLIINDQVIYQEDFNKEFVEIFLKYSLEGLPKKVLITDGHVMYPPIIERISIKHQFCIFHIIKHHNDKSYKKNEQNKKKNTNTRNKNKRKRRKNNKTK